MYKAELNSLYLRPLREDHRFGLLFCWRVKEGIDLGIETRRIANYVHFFWSRSLCYHFRDEEMLIFSGNSVPVFQKTRNEHLDFHNRIQAIITGDDIINPVQLQELVKLLEAHIRFEEKELFPYLRNAFVPGEAKIADAVLPGEAFSPHLKHLYPDEFWKEGRPSL